MPTLEERVETLESSMSTAQTDITDLQDDVDDIKEDIESLQESAAAVAGAANDMIVLKEAISVNVHTLQEVSKKLYREARNRRK